MALAQGRAASIRIVLTFALYHVEGTTMYLMYYTDSEGKRVYTLKVSANHLEGVSRKPIHTFTHAES